MPAKTEDRYAAARERIIALLGENWVLHPNYKPRPRHSTRREVWVPDSVLFKVHVDAFNARRLPYITIEE